MDVRPVDRERKQTNQIGDRVGRIQVKKRVGEILHCAHTDVITGKCLCSRYGRRETEEIIGKAIQITLLNIWSG